LFAGMYNVHHDASALLAKVGLTDKAKTRVDKLSGGQKQRFSIATTLIHKPRVVFLDEPTVGLDPQARRNLWELIRSIRDDGTTVIMTTHYLDEAELLCDRVGIMDEGRIIALDSPERLIHGLLATGFQRPTRVREATLEDVFIQLTGKELRDA
ncbi:MAG TPA: ABC transporter ATP-binding protein, partial [bacterium]|nr:ABC transporter ATP-binding protein [bacterium]